MKSTSSLRELPLAHVNYCSKRNLKFKARFLLGSLLAPTQTKRWHTFLGAHPVMREMAQAHPHFTDKIYRPYLSHRLTCAERVEALIGHYEFMHENGLENLVKHAAAAPLTMAEFNGKSGTSYQIELTASNISHREGELCLRLVSKGADLYTITFIFLNKDGAYCLKIGCLQGMLADNGATSIREATKDFHSARPKNLMISIVCDIAEYFDCSEVQLVSNKNRISINQHRRNRIKSNYDQTWEEIGAVKQADGDYALATTRLPTKSIEDTPSHKRSEARKRNALTDAIFAGVRASFNQWKLADAQIIPFPAKTAPAETNIGFPATKSA
jgi:uncharacterized protein